MSIETQTTEWAQSKDAVPDYVVQITIYDEATGDRVATAFQSQHNANMITATPALYAASKKALEHLRAADWTPGKDEAIEALSAAIAMVQND